MQIVRTVIWVLLLVALLIFSIANWDPTVTVRIWEGLVVDTKIPAIVVVAFLIGFVPTWLYHRAAVWRLKRRIHSLEASLHTVQATQSEAAHESERRRIEEERFAAERPLGTSAPPPV
jgi:uncharacterized membrane protein YciS (DUF1049 family)